ELEKEPVNEEEKQLYNRFKNYENSQKEILQIIEHWDRVQGLLLQSAVSDEYPQEAEDQVPERLPTSGKKSRKDREKERQEKLEKERAEKERLEKAEKERLEKLKAEEMKKGLEKEDQEIKSEVGFPHVELHVDGAKDLNVQKILDSGKLPLLDDVSVHKKKKEEQATPTKSRLKKDKPETGRESQKEKRRTGGTRKGHQGDSRLSPPAGALTPLSDADHLSLIGEQCLDRMPKKRLTSFRWLVPPNGEVVLRLHFESPDVGMFDQTLNFEILGTQRRYQLYCRGVCTFPTIVREPRTVFHHRKKDRKGDEVVHKKYIMSLGVFDFGPLLCGKTREKYKGGKYPENMEHLTICNPSPMDAEVIFCFQHDIKASTFLLDPPSMTLKPHEKMLSKVLKIWAYPTTPGIFEDSLVCCIRENPEPVLFRVACHGVRPELELDRKQLHFDRLLLHR
uniref:HYDIN protein n=1 Tax=Latimeria chalumnae TaxID=7897 RepID=H3AHD1_LATCH